MPCVPTRSTGIILSPPHYRIYSWPLSPIRLLSLWPGTGSEESSPACQLDLQNLYIVARVWKRSSALAQRPALPITRTRISLFLIWAWRRSARRPASPFWQLSRIYKLTLSPSVSLSSPHLVQYSVQCDAPWSFPLDFVTSSPSSLQGVFQCLESSVCLPVSTEQPINSFILLTWFECSFNPF